MKSILTRKQIHLFFSLLIAGIGLLLSNFYRPYIYQNGINDFHFADTIGNWVAVPAYVHLQLAISKKKIILRKRIIYIVLTFIIIEFLGLIHNFTGTFDWYDVVATIISGILTYLIMKNFARYHETEQSKNLEFSNRF